MFDSYRDLFLIIYRLDFVNEIGLWMISLQYEHARGAIGAFVLLWNVHNVNT